MTQYSNYLTQRNRFIGSKNIIIRPNSAYAMKYLLFSIKFKIDNFIDLTKPSLKFQKKILTFVSIEFNCLFIWLNTVIIWHKETVLLVQENQLFARAAHIQWNICYSQSNNN